MTWVVREGETSKLAAVITPRQFLLTGGLKASFEPERIPFITKDGSRVSSLLDRSNTTLEEQSFGEGNLPAGGETDWHYYKPSEKYYDLLTGRGVMEADDSIVLKNSLALEYIKMTVTVGNLVRFFKRGG